MVSQGSAQFDSCAGLFFVPQVCRLGSAKGSFVLQLNWSHALQGSPVSIGISFYIGVFIIMKRLITSVVLATTLFSVGAMAQSAKFAAVWTDGTTVVRSEACATTSGDYCTEAGLSNTGETVGLTMATIKVPQSKELLVGISAQVELMTETIVKGKRGSLSKAMAMAEGGVELSACNASGCYPGMPGRIVLSSRTQELEAILAGIIEDCTVEVQVDPDTGTGAGTFDLGDCTVADEMIGLALSTMAAHHFNFVFPDLPQGDYDIIARFSTNALATAEASCPAESPYCEDGDGNASASAYAIIGKTMMTIQEVRAVKGSLGSQDFDIQVD